MTPAVRRPRTSCARTLPMRSSSTARVGLAKNDRGSARTGGPARSLSRQSRHGVCRGTTHTLVLVLKVGIEQRPGGSTANKAEQVDEIGTSPRIGRGSQGGLHGWQGGGAKLQEVIS